MCRSTSPTSKANTFQKITTCRDKSLRPAAAARILVVNPTDTQTTINYAINDYDYQIAPGSQQELSADQQWVISFDRGDNDGNAEYTLSPGIYTFGPSDHGWELYHTSDSVDN